MNNTKNINVPLTSRYDKINPIISSNENFMKSPVAVRNNSSSRSISKIQTSQT